MAFAVPSSLSPSKVSTFKDCALAFRFTAIDRLAEAPSAPAVKGTFVHRALQGLFWSHNRGNRSPEAAHAELAAVWLARHDDPEYAGLGLEESAEDAFRADCEALVDRYFTIEDPDAVDAVGMELSLEVDFEGVRLRGIIDRLDVTPEGEFVVVDYKTGRAPSETQEQSRLGGVHFYALLCEQVLGRRPVKVRLMYLRQGLSIDAVPSDQAMRGLRQRTTAIWRAIEQACAAEDFRPKPSALCSWCSFQSLCPAFGGDPALASTWEPAARVGVALPALKAPAAAIAG